MSALMVAGESIYQRPGRNIPGEKAMVTITKQLQRWEEDVKQRTTRVLEAGSKVKTDTIATPAERGGKDEVSATAFSSNMTMQNCDNQVPVTVARHHVRDMQLDTNHAHEMIRSM